MRPAELNRISWTFATVRPQVHGNIFFSAVFRTGNQSGVSALDHLSFRQREWRAVVKTLRKQAASAPGAFSDAAVVSFYRSFVRQCQLAAENAHSEKRRSALQAMVRVWNEFAERHEQMTRAAGKSRPRAVRRRSIKGWT